MKNVEEMRFGRGTVQENLERAVADKRLKILPDGCFTLLQKSESSNYLHVKKTRKMIRSRSNGTVT